METYTPAAPAAEAPTGRLKRRGLDVNFAEYCPAPDFPGYNPSGCKPLGPNVLVRTDTSAQHRSSGLILTDSTAEVDDLKATTGVIYAIGKTAWQGYDDDERPHVGDRVVFAKYSGEIPTFTADGAPYRLMDHSCILSMMVAPEGPPVGDDLPSIGEGI